MVGIRNLLGRFNQTSPLHELFGHLSVMMVDEETVFLVQQGYDRHVIRIQLEVENIQVLGHTFLPGAFRKDDDTALYQPPQGYLTRCFSYRMQYGEVEIVSESEDRTSLAVASIFDRTKVRIKSDRRKNVAMLLLALRFGIVPVIGILYTSILLSFLFPRRIRHLSYRVCGCPPHILARSLFPLSASWLPLPCRRV